MVAEDRSLSFKPLFSRSLSSDPDRLHFAAHSHHLWPDASFEGQVQAWNDAAHLADRKWDKVMGEVWPEAQRQVASEIGTSQSDTIVFAPNTHQLLVSLFATVSSSRPIRVLTSDGEFHSARRQFARWEEAGAAEIERILVEPFDTFSERLLEAARSGRHDFIFVSHVLFGSGRIFDPVEELAAFNVDAESVLAGWPNGAFREFMAFQIMRARDLYASAERGIPALDSSGRLATMAAKQLYSEILTEIEKLDYDVFRTRAHLTTGQKFRALPGVLVGFTQLSVSTARFHG